MSDDKTAESPNCKAAHNSLRIQALISGGGGAVVVVLACWALVQIGNAKAESYATAADKAAEVVVAPVRAQVVENKLEAIRHYNLLAAELTEIRKDIRAADRSRRTGERQEQLERDPRPLPLVETK